MWRRMKGQNRSSGLNDLEGGGDESSKQSRSEKENFSEELNMSKKQSDEEKTSSKSSKKSTKKASKSSSHKDSEEQRLSQSTATSKKSFWRARLKSSPTTRRSEEWNRSNKKSSKKSNPGFSSTSFSAKSRTSSTSQNSNQIHLQNFDRNSPEVRKNQNDLQSDSISKSSKGNTSRLSFRIKTNQEDPEAVPSSSTQAFELGFAQDENLAQVRRNNRERQYQVEQSDYSRQYSSPNYTNQPTVVTATRSISTPIDHNMTSVHISEASSSDSRPRHSISSNKRQGRVSSRFSLRRLFYGSNVAQPAVLRSLGPRASIEVATISKSGNPSSNQTSRYGEDNQSDTKSTVWRDNTSSCSSLQGGAAAAISLGGHSTAASLMAVAGGSSSSTVLRECPLCLSECTLEMFPLLRNCHHLFCIDCLQTYVKIEIQEGRVNLRCPQCTELMHPNDIETLIGDKNSNLLTLYESLMLRRLLAVDPDTRWCPGPNCTYAVIAAGCASCPKITCERPGCGYSFCYHCKNEWHPNQTCDAARAQRNHHHASMMGTNLPMALRSSSGTFSLEAISAAGGGVPGNATGVMNNGSLGVASNSGQASEVKVCPRCNTLIVKMDDGSCNHMTCPVCGAEFCWLCMKEISDLHYLSPSGCTFWGKKPWSRKKKLLWQLGTLVGAPVGIALLAGIAVPAMIIGIPSWVGRKIHDHYKNENKHKRNAAVVGGVVSSLIISPFLAGLAVSIGVPILLCYVYGVVPIALCRSEGCGVYTTVNGVRIDMEEDDMDMANAATQIANAVMSAGENAAASFRNIKSGNPTSNQTSFHDHGNSEAGIDHRKKLNVEGSRGNRAHDLVANPSIGEVSLGASLSLGSGCHLNEREQDTDLASRECDRESASNTAMAGTSLTGSFASSYLGARNNDPSVIVNFHRQDESHKTGVNPPSTNVNSIGTYHLQNRLEVDVHNGARKKLSYSSERLSETISLSERSGTISLADADGARSEASTKALAGSLLAYKLGDSQSVGSYHRVIGERSIGDPTSETTSNVVPASSSSMGYGTAAVIGLHEDALSLRSLPLQSAGAHGKGAVTEIFHAVGKDQQLQNPSASVVSVVPPRSLSPVSSMSGDELSYVPSIMNYNANGNNLAAGVISINQQVQSGSKRFSRRPRAMLDKQLSENSSLLGEADTISERVRFDDNVSFIDADSEYVTSDNKSSKSEIRPSDDTRKYSDSSILADINKKLASNENYSYDNVAPINDDIINSSQRGIKGSTIIKTSCTVAEETPEELAQIISPPIVRSQISTSGAASIEDTKSIDSSKHITVTATGSSIVNINKKSFESNETSTDNQEQTDNKIIVEASSNQPETGIFKTNDSMSESHRSDHVTLLSIGDDVSDTQFKDDNQDTK